ncbi:MAG: alpha/beta hydrolase [Chromatiaceae bacterium]|jgi:pimeloyl-ACP methyl ester carboxylesterase|nr:alpha/beta hydrolase [Chromatiaceae bacterium]MBP8282786.1 alpha/beta hydrolase [Chromatiaceae bacterium]
MRPRRFLISVSPLLLGYLFLIGFMTMSQDQLLYLPDPTPPSAANLRPRLGPALATWPLASGPAFRGYVRADAMATQGWRGTLVLFHGNAGSARDRTWYLNALEPLGLRVILAEYPGYGGREGTPSQASLVADGRETVRLARAAFGEPLWVWGESLGAAVAAQVAVAPEGPARGLVLITPWDNLPDLAQALYWYLPARWLVRDRYDTRAALQPFQGPKAVLIAGQDQIVPPAHSQGLYAALPEPKRLWLFPEAGHNNWPAYAAAAWWGETVAWLEAQAPQAANTSTIR